MYSLGTWNPYLELSPLVKKWSIPTIVFSKMIIWWRHSRQYGLESLTWCDMMCEIWGSQLSTAIILFLHTYVAPEEIARILLNVVRQSTQETTTQSSWRSLTVFYYSYSLPPCMPNIPVCRTKIEVLPLHRHLESAHMFILFSVYIYYAL